MKMTYGRILTTALFFLAGFAPEAHAQSNSIDGFNVTQQGGRIVVRVTLKEALKTAPASFTVANPARIAFDFPDTTNALGRNAQNIGESELRSMNMVQAGDRTRMVLNLRNMVSYDTQVDGKTMLVTMSPIASAAKPGAATVSHFAEAKTEGKHNLRDVDFRRGKLGEGRLVIELSDTTTGIDIRQQGQSLIVDFLKTNLPDALRKRLDVVDFATPVQSINIFPQGENVRMVIEPKGLWEHNAYQTDTQFVVEVKPVQYDPNKLTQGSRGGYNGEKLSLNFQNVEVRSVLNVIADFTDLNIITSDSVAGNLTLRLKDVPWDQALDIILQTRGLDMRKNGNVLWIAPRDELATKEKLQLESQSQISELEQTRTESFQLNYQKAAEVRTLLASPQQSLLSKRGSAVVDIRTNKLFVQDVPSRLEEVRKLIAQIDIPVRQVLIEARIVEATDNFSKNLGARLGVNALTPNSVTGTPGSPRFAIGGGINQTLTSTGAVAQGFGTASLDNSLSANLHRWFQPGVVLDDPVQRQPEPLPQPGNFRAGGRWQGQDYFQPARRHRRPGRGVDRAGDGIALPAGHLQRCDQRVFPQGQPGTQGQTADHARRQRHHDAGHQQGLRQPDIHELRPGDRHQARQDRGPGRERRYSGYRRYLHPGRERQHHQGAVLRRLARHRRLVQEHAAAGQ